jgi:hypothetical protein
MLSPNSAPSLPGWNNPAAKWWNILPNSAHREDFADQMRAFQAAGLIKGEADVTKFATAYRPDMILLPMPPASSKSPDQFVWQANKASVQVGADNKRTFIVTETDQAKLPAAQRTVILANQIERTYPGEVVCVHCQIIDLKRQARLGEHDVVTKMYDIEEKDSGKRLLRSLKTTTARSGMPGVGYGTQLGDQVIERVLNGGYAPITDPNDLLKHLKRW